MDRPTAGLLVLIWMSVISALIHVAHRGQRHEMPIFVVAQVACFLAISIEAGYLEANANRPKWSLATRLIALVLVTTHIAVSVS